MTSTIRSATRNPADFLLSEGYIHQPDVDCKSSTAPLTASYTRKASAHPWSARRGSTVFSARQCRDRLVSRKTPIKPFLHLAGSRPTSACRTSARGSAWLFSGYEQTGPKRERARSTSTSPAPDVADTDQRLFVVAAVVEFSAVANLEQRFRAPPAHPGPPTTN
jgi:hypothetical protein